jgi:hypothetical protein
MLVGRRTGNFPYQEKAIDRASVFWRNGKIAVLSKIGTGGIGFLGGEPGIGL